MPQLTPEQQARREMAFQLEVDWIKALPGEGLLHLECRVALFGGEEGGRRSRREGRTTSWRWTGYCRAKGADGQGLGKPCRPRLQPPGVLAEACKLEES